MTSAWLPILWTSPGWFYRRLSIKRSLLHQRGGIRVQRNESNFPTKQGLPSSVANTAKRQAAANADARDKPQAITGPFAPLIPPQPAPNYRDLCTHATPVQVESPQEDRHLWVMSRKCKHGESKTARWNITKAVHLLSTWLQWAKEKELLKHGGKVTPVPLDPPPKEQRRRTAPDQTGPKTSAYPFCSDKCVSTNLENYKGTKTLKSGQRKKFTADPLKLSSLTCIQRNFN